MGIEIFISYRRTDAGGHAGRLHDRLVDYFDRDRIFYDLESIEWGDRFPERIEQAVRECKAFLAVMAPDWLVATDAAGRRRLDDEKDFVRREIALALAEGKKAFVVALGGARVPTAADLPAVLAALADCDVAELGGKSFEYDRQIAQLVKLIAAVPGVSAPREPTGRARLGPRLLRTARCLGITLITAFAVRAFLVASMPDWVAAEPVTAHWIALAWGALVGAAVEGGLYVWRRKRTSFAGAPVR